MNDLPQGGVTRVIEGLITDALDVLHHDRTEGSDVDKYERSQLFKKFLSRLSHLSLEIARLDSPAGNGYEAAAEFLEWQAEVTTNSLHCGDNSITIQNTHRYAEGIRNAAKMLRAAPPKAPSQPESDGLLKLFEDHYWDTFERDKDLVLAHVRAVLTLSGRPE